MNHLLPLPQRIVIPTILLFSSCIHVLFSYTSLYSTLLSFYSFFMYYYFIYIYVSPLITIVNNFFFSVYLNQHYGYVITLDIYGRIFYSDIRFLLEIFWGVSPVIMCSRIRCVRPACLVVLDQGFAPHQHCIQLHFAFFNQKEKYKHINIHVTCI